MKHGKNIVLYAVENGAPRRPLVSLSPDDKFAASKLQHAASSEYLRAERSGIAHPVLRCIGEHREADEAGKVTVSGSFVELDPVTLEPLIDAETVDDLEILFPAHVVTVSGVDEAARSAAEANIQKIIAAAVSSALAEQRKAMDASTATIPAPAAKAKKAK